MRTTVTIDPAVEARLLELMQERGLGFKAALNATLRAGLGMDSVVDVAFPVFGMGEPSVDLTHANRIASALEDDEIARSLAVGR